MYHKSSLSDITDLTHEADMPYTPSSRTINPSVSRGRENGTRIERRSSRRSDSDSELLLSDVEQANVFHFIRLYRDSTSTMIEYSPPNTLWRA